MNSKVNCQSCQFLYNHKRIPYVLGCGHTFCHDCIKCRFSELEKNKHSSDDEIVRCYKCKQKSQKKINQALYQQILQNANMKFVDKVVKVCFFGETSVGKTSLVKRLVQDKYCEALAPTIGMNFDFIDKDFQGYKIRFQMWDSAGTQRYRSIPSMQYKNADIAILVYDVKSQDLQNEINYWVDQIAQYCSTQNFIIVGNKIDLEAKSSGNENVQENHYTLENRIQNADLMKKIKQAKHQQLSVSCKQQKGINQLWGLMGKLTLKKSKADAFRSPDSLILAPSSSIQAASSKTKKSCCSS